MEEAVRKALTNILILGAALGVVFILINAAIWSSVWLPMVCK